MNSLEAMRRMMQSAHMSQVQTSEAIGRNKKFIGSVLSQRCSPNVRLLLMVADACGYELRLVGHGRELVVDDPDCTKSRDKVGRLEEDARRLGYRLVPMNDVEQNIEHDAERNG